MNLCHNYYLLRCHVSTGYCIILVYPPHRFLSSCTQDRFLEDPLAKRSLSRGSALCKETDNSENPELMLTMTAVFFCHGLALETEANTTVVLTRWLL